MAKEGNVAVRLGLFVLAGTVLLVLGLYLLGSKRGLFSSTITVSAEFRQVGGLRPGNNVRYAGINVGTVERLSIMNDSTVRVDIALREDQAAHIRSNAIVSIGSDGLMGNKLMNIGPGDGPGEPVTDGSMLQTSIPLDTDAMLETLDRTNDNLAAITTDLRLLAERLNRPGSVLDLFSDTALAAQLRSSLSELNATAQAARSATEQANALIADVRGGKGALGTLIGDPVAEQQVKGLLQQLQLLSDSLSSAAGEVERFSTGLNDPKGLAHALTQDTIVANDVRRSLANLEQGSELLNENLKALQRNWFFRRYFKGKDLKRDGRSRD
jgi:phospholipid/cholesterol/gamma-HCH transport system substrate-binding protein